MSGIRTPPVSDALRAYAHAVGLAMVGMILCAIVALGLTIAGLAGVNIVLPAYGWALISWLMLLVCPFVAYRNLMGRVRALEEDRDTERKACEEVRGLTVLVDGTPQRVGWLIAADEARFGGGTSHSCVARVIAKRAGVPEDRVAMSSVEALFNRLALIGVLGDGVRWSHQYGSGTTYALNDVGRKVAQRMRQEYPNEYV